MRSDFPISATKMFPLSTYHRMKNWKTEFDVRFRTIVAGYMHKPQVSTQEACQFYEALSNKQCREYQIFNAIAKDIDVPSGHLGRYYWQEYNKCIYDAPTDEVKKFVRQRIADYVAQDPTAEKRGVWKLLKEELGSKYPRTHLPGVNIYFNQNFERV